MKKIAFVVVSLFATLRSFSQSDSNYVDIGINAIRIAQLGFNSDPGDDWNPYALHVNAQLKRFGLRVGLGMDSHTQTEWPSDANGKVRTDRDTLSNDIRIGANWAFQLSPRWTFKAGLDYFTAKRAHSLSTEFINENDEEVKTLTDYEYKESGIAPVLFIQYHFTPRVSLGTELIYRISSYTISTEDSNSLSDLNIVRDFDGNKRYFMLPSALFLSVRF